MSARLAVGLVVEVLEEEEEHDCVHADPPDEGTRVLALDEQQLERVRHYADELGLCTDKHVGLSDHDWYNTILLQVWIPKLRGCCKGNRVACMRSEIRVCNYFP